jgi:hypothetical protein
MALQVERAYAAKIVAIHSLLAQFSHPQVRADFVNGKFGIGVNPGILPVLDELHWTIFPRWLGSGFSAAKHRNENAVDHLKLSISSSPDIFLTNIENADQCLACHEWNSV